MGKIGKKLDFHSIVKNKKLPILTLDSRWHDLFPEEAKNSRIKELERRVNQLLKKQGKLVNDIKDMKKLKKELLKDIVVNMDIAIDKAGIAKEKKLDKNKQYIYELNDKLDRAMDELSKLPYQIREVNEALMIESLKLSYDRYIQNQRELYDITAWIAGIREELTNKILVKQDLEAKNNQVYTYMHDILGAELMEAFDQEFKQD